VVSLALLVGLYEVISTLLDYQFTATLARSLDGAAIGRQMGRAFALMNATALFVQLFVTAPVLRRYGARGALLCLPISLTCASLGMLVFPVLPMASLLPALDSGFAYSVHQSAKEGMYVPLESDAKYRAKAFVDVLVLRGAKALGIVLSLGAAALVGDAAGMRWLSLLTLALVVPFGLCALRAGRRSEHVGHAPVEPASASAVATRRPVLP
jgi:AAA family ATP:ADP antiporter